MNDDYEQHLRTIVLLDRQIWHENISELFVKQWLAQFTGRQADADEEQKLMLRLVSRFMYFGKSEIEVLCRSLYAEHLIYPMVHEFRLENDDLKDAQLIEDAIREQLQRTIIVAPGNPAESATHLLYSFRVANQLSPEMFVPSADLLNSDNDEYAHIKRVVIVDDLCATGGTAKRYHADVIQPLISQYPGLKILYLTLFATARGLREASKLLETRSAMLLDDSYVCFGPQSRYFTSNGASIKHSPDVTTARAICRTYGRELYRQHPLGYGNSQLLLGFAHNIPNNTLPVIWNRGPNQTWRPFIQRRGKNRQGT